MNPITTVKKAISTARLRREVNRLEAARDELARRDAEAAQAEEEAGRVKAEAAKKVKIDALTGLAGSTYAEAAGEHAAFLEDVTEAAATLERRDAVLQRLVGLQSELEALGASCPSPNLKNPPGTVDAALSLGRTLAEIVVEGNGSFSGTSGDVLAKVHAAAGR